MFINHSISKRGFFQKEIRTALDTLDEISEGEIYLILVRSEECIIIQIHRSLRDGDSMSGTLRKGDSGLVSVFILVYPWCSSLKFDLINLRIFKVRS